MVDKLFLLEPQAAPLYVLVSKLNKAPAHSTTIYWLEDALNPSWATVTATASASLTGITVVTGEGNYFNKYDLVKIPATGEVILVTATEASGITAVRGYGSTAAANIASAASLVIIGSAFEEGSANTTLYTKSTVSSTKTNYLQIFRKSVEITKTLAASDLYGGPDRPYQRKKKGIELMRDLERAFLFGEPYEDTGSKETTRCRSPRSCPVSSTRKFGDEVTNELVEWFNQVDAAYRSDLRDFNEINFGRFDSRLTERLALSDARLGRRLAEFERRLKARLEAKLEARLVPIEERLLAVEPSLVELDRKIETRTLSLRTEIAQAKTEMVRWMFAFWVATVGRMFLVRLV